MSTIGNLNYRWSQALVSGFVAAGVARAVISPGSRSTPLALAMLRQPGLICDVAVDERCAAFFALGQAKASRQPVLLLATSGTAPANWLPAVIEASQSGVPLILLSADRPPELQQCGANQTVNQSAMFSPYVRAAHLLGAPDAGFDPGWLHRLAAQMCEQASWPRPGPVHLNQPFREPLLPSEPLPDAPDLPRIHTSQPVMAPEPQAIADLARTISGRPGLIVAGESPFDSGYAEALTALAGQLDCPILAEPLSNLRFGTHDRSRLCVRYNRWLADPVLARRCRPEWVLRFGATPVTRHLQQYLASLLGTHAWIEPTPGWSDPAHRLTHLLRADPAAACRALLAAVPAAAAPAWREAFVAAERQAEADQAAPHIAALIAELPDDCAVFVGNSLAIRQLDSNSGGADKALCFYGNRGASGIDGNISTAAGIAAIHGRVVALLGDLTCQHDLGGLALLQGRNAVVVAVNNAGGGIFDYLPQAALAEFETGWRTPQQISFRHAAQTFSLGYHAVESIDAFGQSLRAAFQSGGPQLIELRLP
ncbi:2-succinyl-5-enolpyruvyl-6-hydroxy-3-cyclohexene-1-carboxylic-acid synthase [Dechloromonas sp. TW-R-39-2]|uniref:2-succinyl-5-enolpyruvyl-6-hydroxy-3- cyclohexene-1-carboxylic-acid synthase n=1 Tax=Dechloromonas sp. TW-R-39-2 TaxID=2654218 RepID=UPI00193D9830|nr:2-succinyl-5-enolpyruvyl-6-hydroxy-3-cyclohexene-1-carboxylic-acid synthase [Dechloromonas sp. TW-R-39-2]QRM19806.1 2-succinyl-5-enolpyruvyl-6-hydroxy-3-cyclohexene-1-carboxylic-acid synthase [Dechloromonas sp. TW-R-39-2]